MKLDPDLIDLLACPETKKALVMADEELVQKVNQAIASRQLRNKDQKIVEDAIDAGLLRVDDTDHMYPVREGIPILLVEELLLIKSITSNDTTKE